MSRRTFAVAALAALTTLAAALPGLPSLTVASSCSGWSSSATPPSSIRVFRHASGAVETVNFKSYTKNVLSREWIASWSTASLRSGALATKHYAWYQVLHWRGGTTANKACFDVRDDTADQVYDPSRPTYTTAAAAVDATWPTRVLKNGAIFPTYYNAGASGEGCGANANGWKLYQWGTQACGLAGKTAAQIMLTYYYPGVTVTDASDPTPTPTPKPTALPTPRPTATPTPRPPSATGAPSTPSATRTPRPTPTPTPKPTPVPTPPPALATPPPSQSLPGGGQSGIVNDPAPPAPPPSNPQPEVASANRGEETHHAGAKASDLARFHAWALSDAAPGSALWPAYRLAGMRAPDASDQLRLLAFNVLWRSALDELADGLMRRLAGGNSVVLARPPADRAP